MPQVSDRLASPEFFGAVLADNHPYAQRALDAAAQLYESWGRAAEAQVFRDRLERG